MAEILSSLAYALTRAVDHDLPVVKYQRPILKYGERAYVDAERRPYEDELQVYHFPQTWGSTALGFGGVGGQAFTTAYTTVVMDHIAAAVYFGGRLAYVIPEVNQAFMEDLARHGMAEKGCTGKYRTKRAQPSMQADLFADANPPQPLQP